MHSYKMHCKIMGFFSYHVTVKLSKAIEQHDRAHIGQSILNLINRRQSLDIRISYCSIKFTSQTHHTWFCMKFRKLSKIFNVLNVFITKLKEKRPCQYVKSRLKKKSLHKQSTDVLLFLYCYRF